MDLVALQTFGAVARTGSVARAAAELNCVPSCVTSRIKILERELGVSLFHRHSRGMEISSEGRTLLPYAYQLSSLISDARRAFAGSSGVAGQLRLGAMETTAAQRLPTLLSAFHDRFPAVTLELTTGPTAALVDEVANFTLDGAFVAGPVGHVGLREEAVIEEDLVVVTAKRHTDLERYLTREQHPMLLVYRAGCLYRQRLEAYLFSRGIAGTRRTVLGTVEGILGCVEADMGISIIARAAISEAMKSKRVAVHELGDEYSKIMTVFITPKNVRESAAMREFRQCLREVFAASEHDCHRGISVAEAGSMQISNMFDGALPRPDADCRTQAHAGL